MSARVCVCVCVHVWLLHAYLSKVSVHKVEGEGAAKALEWAGVPAKSIEAPHESVQVQHSVACLLLGGLLDGPLEEFCQAPGVCVCVYGCACKVMTLAST